MIFAQRIVLTEVLEMIGLRVAWTIWTMVRSGPLKSKTMTP
jgi:hypothetical protein